MIVIPMFRTRTVYRSAPICVHDIRFAWWYRLWLDLKGLWKGNFYFSTFAWPGHQAGLQGWRTIDRRCPDGFTYRKCIVSWFGFRRVYEAFPWPKGLTEFFHAHFPFAFVGQWHWINYRQQHDSCTFDPVKLSYGFEEVTFDQG